MPWIELTPEHIAESLAAAELEALRTLQLEDGQVDPIPEAISRTTLEVRGYVAAYHGQLVGNPGTIPAELLSSAISIARWRVIGRLPSKIFATEARRLEYTDGLAQLKDVATGKFAVSVPSSPAPEQPRPIAEGRFGSVPSIFGTGA